MPYCPECGAEVNEEDVFCSECGNNIDQLRSSDNTTQNGSSSSDRDPSEEEMSFTERVKHIQEKRDDSGANANESSYQTETDESNDGITWTLSFVVGGLMSLLAILLGIYYAAAMGNIVSGVLFVVAGLFGNGYLNGEFNMSKWLATAIFLLFWMSGSFFIGTGAA